MLHFCRPRLDRVLDAIDWRALQENEGQWCLGHDVAAKILARSLAEYSVVLLVRPFLWAGFEGRWLRGMSFIFPSGRTPLLKLLENLPKSIPR